LARDAAQLCPVIMLLGCALWAVLPQPKTPAEQARLRIGQLLALGAAVLGLLTLTEYLFGWNTGIRLAVSEGGLQLKATDDTLRAAFPSAVSALGIGLSLVLLNVAFRGVWLAEVFAVITVQVAVLGLIGHAFGVSELYGQFQRVRAGGMAMHAALGFLVLGLECSVHGGPWDHGDLRSQTPGGRWRGAGCSCPCCCCLPWG